MLFGANIKTINDSDDSILKCCDSLYILFEISFPKLLMISHVGRLYFMCSHAAAL